MSGFERWCRGGGYGYKIDSSLLGWAKEKLGLLVETIKRSDDIKGFSAAPASVGGGADLRLVDPQPRLARGYEQLTATSEAMIKIAMTD